MRDSGPWDEDGVLAYLESAPEIYSTMGAERDVLTRDEWTPGAGSPVTAGSGRRTDETTQSIRLHLTDVLAPDREETVTVLARTLDQDATERHRSGIDRTSGPRT